jgi:hypothetical protein
VQNSKASLSKVLQKRLPTETAKMIVPEEEERQNRVTARKSGQDLLRNLRRHRVKYILALFST